MNAQHVIDKLNNDIDGARRDLRAGRMSAKERRVTIYSALAKKAKAVCLENSEGVE